MKIFFAIAGAGAAGALARHYLGSALQRWSGSEFPWGTLFINVTGCFLFGLLVGLFESRWAVSETGKALLLTGFLGAYTTFSTFGFHTALMLHEHHYGAAFANFALNNLIGIALVFLGLALGRGF